MTVAGTGTYLVEPEDHRDGLLGADGDQVVRQQLAGRQELVIAALVDEDVQPGPRVRRRQRRGVVRLRDAQTPASHQQPLLTCCSPAAHLLHTCCTPAGASRAQAEQCCPRRRQAGTAANAQGEEGLQGRGFYGAGLQGSPLLYYSLGCN